MTRIAQVVVVVLGVMVVLGSASAAERVMVAGKGAQWGGAPSVSAPAVVSLRGGAMFSPNSAGMGGVDIAVPGISLLPGWEGRLDADVIFKASFAEVKTVVPVTFSQVHYVQDMSGRSLYFGLGGGALLGGTTKLIGKGIVGVELGPRLGVEGNLIFSEAKTMILAVGRLHL